MRLQRNNIIRAGCSGFISSSHLLQNVHLLAGWLCRLEELLDITGSQSHSDFRVFMSGEPAAGPGDHIIPCSMLENSLKLTAEPPTGMKSNLHAALDNFTQVFKHFCTNIIHVHLDVNPSL